MAGSLWFRSLGEILRTADFCDRGHRATVREVAPNIPIIARVEDKESIDILELSGCNYVLPLHQRLRGLPAASMVRACR
jgi:hypothetical protein